MSLRPLLVLFLSTGNAARSLIAEAILNSRGSDRYTARSAGFAPLSAPHPETLALLAGMGLATSGLHTKGWSEFHAAAHLVPVDVIVTLSAEAREQCPLWPGAPVRVNWSVDNPLGAARSDIREWKFRKCYGTLAARIDALLAGRDARTPGELLMRFKDIGMVV